MKKEINYIDSIALDTKTDLEKFLQQVLTLQKDTTVTSIKIQVAYTLTEKENYYVTDEFIYIEFDNNRRLAIFNPFYSLGCGSLLSCDENNPNQYYQNHNFKIFDFLKDSKFIGYKVEGFTHAYSINPSTDEGRPDGGDYYSYVFLYFDNHKALCFIAQEYISDGYMDIYFLENITINTDTNHFIWKEKI